MGHMSAIWGMVGEQMSDHADRRSSERRRRTASIFALVGGGGGEAETGCARTVICRVESACTSTVLGIVVDKHVVGHGQQWAVNGRRRRYRHLHSRHTSQPPLLQFNLLSPRKLSRGIMESPAYVCLFVCLFVCYHDN